MPAAAYITIQFPSFQTWAAQKVVESIEDKIDGKIEVEKVAISFLNKVIVKNASIVGNDGDTLAAVGKLSVTLSLFDMEPGFLEARRIIVEDGYFNLQIDSSKGSNLAKIFRIEPKPVDTTYKSWGLPDMAVNDITIRNFHFILHNKGTDTIVKPYGCMNYAHFDLYDIDVRLTRAKYEAKKLTCRIRSLTCKDSCGYEVKALNSDYFMDSTQIRFDNLFLKDSYSTVNARYLSFGYTKGRDINDYVNKIVMGADFFNTTLDFRTVGVYAPTLKDNRLQMLIDGEVIGPVRDLRSKDLRVRMGDSTDVRVGVAITGLPNIDSTYFNFTFKDVNTIMPEVAEIVSSFAPSFKRETFDKIVPDVRLNVQGIAYGTLSDVYSTGTITTRIGDIDYHAQTYPDLKGNGRDVSIEIGAENLDLGHITSSELLGKGTLSTAININILPQDVGMIFNGKLDSLVVHRLEMNGYDYGGIVAVGEIENNMADMRLISNNDAIPLLFHGVFQMDSTLNPQRFNGYLNLPQGDLAAIGLDNKNAVSELGFTANIDIRKGRHETLLGHLNLSDIYYHNEKGSHEIKEIHLDSYIEENVNIITLDSPMLRASYKSDDVPSKLVRRIKNSMFSRNLPSLIRTDELFTDSLEIAQHGNYYFTMETYNLAPICKVVMPDLYIADSTTVRFSLTKEDNIDLEVKSDFIRVGKNRFSQIDLRLDNDNFFPYFALNADELSVMGIPLQNNNIEMRVQEGFIDFNYRFANETVETNALDFNSRISFDRDLQNKLITKIAIDTSKLQIKNRGWSFTPSTIILGPKYYRAENFSLYNNDESIKINGAISESPSDTMLVELDNFDISIANSFFQKDIDLQGNISGMVSLYNIFSSTGILLSLEGDRIKIDDNDVGHLTVMSKWDHARERFNILVNNSYQRGIPLNITGYFVPSRNNINLTASFDSFRLPLITPFLKDIVNISNGTISGSVNLNGSLNSLMLSSSNTFVDTFEFTPMYTKVTYMVSGPIDIAQNSISLKDMTIHDPQGNKATLSGTISHNSFRNLALNARIGFQNFQCLNTTEKDNSTFYGKAFASGEISINGPFDDLIIDADVSTNDNTTIHVPLSSASSAKNSDLISFENFSKILTEDYHLGYETSQEVKENSKIEVRAKASISDNTLLMIELNKSLGDILQCRGNGDIDLWLNPSRNIFDLRGDYTISEGSYHFAFSIGAKDFIIDNGGSISFNGGVMNTSMNVGATYQTKASVSTLISDTTSVASRRTVNCGVNLRGSLSNPELSFSIDIPDLDPITKGRVESALSTPDKVQRQFMALLISGSFVPDEQSGIFNNTTILYSNASEIVANQFNNIFRQLDIPLDLGFNYQPGSGQGGKDMFDVALSLQAFNNRLIINGNVGNSANTISSVAGNLEAEYKVDKQGKLRLTVFTRAADSYSNYLDNTQRSGIGISFQTEFDTFGEFFRNIIFGRKRKERYELEMMQKALDELKMEAEEANIKMQEILKPKENPLQHEGETVLIEYNN